MDQIQNLPLVMMLSEFEEYSEYENIFTHNYSSITERQTAKLNRQIQEFVADNFCEVKIKINEDFGQETKLNLDSDASDEEKDKKESPENKSWKIKYVD